MPNHDPYDDRIHPSWYPRVTHFSDDVHRNPFPSHGFASDPSPYTDYATVRVFEDRSVSVAARFLYLAMRAGWLAGFATPAPAAYGLREEAELMGLDFEAVDALFLELVDAGHINTEGGPVRPSVEPSMDPAATPPSPRAMDATAGSKLSSSLRWRIFRRDGYVCLACGTDTDLTVDHIQPASKGGPSTEENLQTLCRPCNSRKGDR